jgi:hypothetical protein
MPAAPGATSLAARVRASRLRNTIARQLDFIRRCEAIETVEIDDATFAELLAEAVEDLGLRKERISDALEFNLASIYRWLARKSMPALSIRPKLLMKVATLVRHEIDDSVKESIEDRRTRQPASWSSLSNNAARLSSPAQPRTFIAGAPAELVPLEGPFGRPAGNSRPTFAAFAWRGVGEFQLLPAAAISEAWIHINAPGATYYSHEKHCFLPISVREDVSQLLLMSAGDRHSSTLPSITLRAPPGAIASGTLVLTSEDGVPLRLGDDKDPQAAVYEANCAEPVPPPMVLELALPRSSDAVRKVRALVEVTPGEIASAQAHYDHHKALQLGNFGLYQDRNHQGFWHSLRESWLKPKGDGSFEKSAVSPRIIVFNEGSERFSAHAIYLCRHQGGELIIPLYGAVNAHLFDSSSEFPNSHQLAHHIEFQLSEAISETDVYDPFMLVGSHDSVVGAPYVLALNSQQVFHGFTALSRCASFLTLAISSIGRSDRWVARSAVDQPIRRSASW